MVDWFIVLIKITISKVCQGPELNVFSTHRRRQVFFLSYRMVESVMREKEIQFIESVWFPFKRKLNERGLFDIMFVVAFYL